MFFSIIATLSPLFRNSAAALTPLNPPPTIRTSHLMSLLSGGQCLNCFTSNVVNHQSWLIMALPLEAINVELNVAIYNDTNQQRVGRMDCRSQSAS